MSLRNLNMKTIQDIIDISPRIKPQNVLIHNEKSLKKEIDYLLSKIL